MSERTYYPINEKTARAAHDMMSFSDYTEGSKTAEYRRDVDRAYDLADRVAAKKPDEAERVYRLAGRYAKKMAEYYNREASIGTICPSIMIIGGSNFPVRKKEKQVAAWDRNHQFYTEVQGILSKIENILHGREIIKSDDERAIEKLEEKLDDMKKLQGQMKAANKAIRLKDTEAGDDLLREMGYSEEDIKSLREPDFCGRIGYPDYALSNNNANIHRVEGRIKELKATKERGGSEQEISLGDLPVTVKENAEDMRIQLFFDGKPEQEVRDILKGEAFKWSPRNGCWQRQLTGNARSATRRVLQKLKEIGGGQGNERL